VLRARMPQMPDAALTTLVPDWACEVLSASTQTLDRAKKLPSSPASGSHTSWLVHLIARTPSARDVTG
jgi:hypothetical protein